MSDQELIAYVNGVIGTGATEIAIPAALLAAASEEAIAEVRRVCRVCGVTITAVRT